MGYSPRTLWVFILLMVVVLTLLQTVDAEDELEVFAGQDKTGRVDTPVNFNDARIIKPDPLDPFNEYSFSWDFNNRMDMNLDGFMDNDDQSNEMFTQWTYRIAGTYVVTLTVDDGMFVAKDTLEVTIKANEPPYILANETENARVGVEFIFNAEAIDDASPPHLLRWYWDFDDGTTSSQPPPVPHTYDSEGTYVVTIKVTDPEGAWTQHVITLTVDEFPVTSSINIIKGQTINGTFVFKGTCTSDVPLLVRVSIDGEPWWAAGNMEWSHRVDTTKLVHGVHTIEVSASSSQYVYEIIMMEFIVDQPPVVWIADYYETFRYKWNGTVIINGTASDDGELLRVEARVDAGPWTATDGIDEWSFTIETRQLSRGNHTLWVRALDNTQNSSLWAAHFYVDQVPRAYIDDVEDWRTTSTGLVATGSWWNDESAPWIFLRVDGGDWENVGLNFDIPPIFWRHEINTSGLAMGDHVLEVMANDGSWISPIASATFHTDRAPEVTIDPLPDDKKVKSGLILTGTLSDDGTVERIEYSIDSAEWVNFTVHDSWTVEVPVGGLKNGIHIIEVRAYDGVSYSTIANTTFRKEWETKEEPGFGAALVALALLGSAVIAVSRRR